MSTIIGNFLILAAHAMTPVPGSLEAALAKADQCDTDTSWVTNLGFPGGDGPYVAECGDADGNETSSKQARAELHYHMALSAGADADAAYEDAIARDAALDAAGLLPCYQDGRLESPAGEARAEWLLERGR